MRARKEFSLAAQGQRQSGPLYDANEKEEEEEVGGVPSPGHPTRPPRLLLPVSLLPSACRRCAAVLCHPREFALRHAIGLHHVVSLLLLAAALAFLVTLLLLGYLRYDQVRFTEYERKWQATSVDGVGALSLDDLEKLVLSPPVATAAAVVGRRVPRNAFTITRPATHMYTEQELLARHAAMDIVYTYVNGSESNHKFRRALTAPSSALCSENATTACVDGPDGGGGAPDIAAPHFLWSEMAYYQLMQSRPAAYLAAVVGSSSRRRGNDGNREGAGRGAQEEGAVTVAWCRTSLARLSFLLTAMETALRASASTHEDPSADDPHLVQASTAASPPPPPQRFTRSDADDYYNNGLLRFSINMDSANQPQQQQQQQCSWTRERGKRVVLQGRRALVKESLATAKAFFDTWPDKARGKVKGTVARRRRRFILDRLLYVVLPFLEELETRAVAAPTATARAAARSLVRTADEAAADNRDRESDELRYSLRSLAQHVRWHRGRVMLVSPGHVPEWLDHAKNFLASVCVDSAVDGSDAEDFYKMHRRAHDESGTSGLDARERFLAFVALQQQQQQQHGQGRMRGGGGGVGSVVCFASADARKRFSLALLRDTNKAAARDGAPRRQRWYRLRMPKGGGGDIRATFLLSTNLDMERFEIGVRASSLHAFLARTGGGHDHSQGRDSSGRGKPEVFVIDEEDGGVVRAEAHRPTLAHDATDERRDEDIFPPPPPPPPPSIAGMGRDGGAWDRNGQGGHRYYYFSSVPVDPTEEGEEVVVGGAGGCAVARVVHARLGDRMHEALRRIEQENRASAARATTTTTATATAAADSVGPRRLHIIHQDALLPYGSRLTTNSFTIEANLFRLHALSPLHLYVNDDYFFNRELPITKLVNPSGGVVVREDNLLPTARRAPWGSTEWRAGVDHTNLFLIHAVEGGGALSSGGSSAATSIARSSSSSAWLSLPDALRALWQRRNRRSSSGGSGSSMSSATPKGAVLPSSLSSAALSRSPDAYPVAQELLAVAARGVRARRKDACALRDILSFLFGEDVEEDSTSPSNSSSDGGGVQDAGIEISSGDAGQAVAEEEERALLPPPLPEAVFPKHHRRFSMHAPFTYCTGIFRYVDARYEPELRLNAYVHRRRSARDLHPPYLHNELVLKQPWVASPQYLSYLAQQQWQQQGFLPEEEQMGNETWRGHPPSRVNITLDNVDGCAPATLLAQGEAEGRFTKFTDSFAQDTLQIEMVEADHPLFFNVNTDFSHANVSRLLRTYAGFKFAFPSFLERTSGSDGDDAKEGHDDDAVHASPFYAYIRETVLDHAQRRQAARAKEAASRGKTQPRACRALGSNSNSGSSSRGGGMWSTEETSGECGPPVRERLEHLPAGVTVRPPHARGLAVLFDQLMSNVPLFLIANDDEAFCPLVRSLRHALPAYRGRRLVLLFIAPDAAAASPSASSPLGAAASPSGQRDSASTRAEGRGGGVGGDDDDDDGHAGSQLLDNLAVLRARHRHPVTNYVPARACAGFVGGRRHRRFLRHHRRARDMEEEGEEMADSPRVVERYNYPAGTSARTAVGEALKDMFRREMPTDPQQQQEGEGRVLRRYLLHHTATLPRLHALSSASSRRAATDNATDTATTSAASAALLWASVVHAVVVDARSNFSTLVGYPASLEEGRRRQRVAYELLARALAVPGQLLSLEDFTFTTFTKGRSAERKREGASDDDDYVSFLKRHMSPDGAESHFFPDPDEEGRPAAALTVAHGALLLRHRESQRRDGWRGKGRRTNGESSVHWITGASERDLLLAFPYPSRRWEWSEPDEAELA